MAGLAQQQFQVRRFATHWQPWVRQERSGIRCLPQTHRVAIRLNRKLVLCHDRSRDDQKQSEAYAKQARTADLRTEITQPASAIRLYLLWFSVGSSLFGALIAVLQIVALNMGKVREYTLEDIYQALAVDLVWFVGSALLLRNEIERRRKTRGRMMREETLAALKVELATGKTCAMGRLRGIVRPVLVAGTVDQVAAALEAAEPFKESLIQRAVFIVPLPLFEKDEARLQEILVTPSQENLKWIGIPVGLSKWRTWFKEQLELSKSTEVDGLYISMRIDGRIRSSGVGSPPWNIINATIAPLEGMWKGFLDGMDGRVL